MAYGTKCPEGDGTPTSKSYTKYGAEGAPVTKNGGNDAIHDHKETKGGTTTPLAEGSYNRSKKT